LNIYPESVLNLIKSLSKLPGIGRKTAERLSLHILHAPDHEARTLANNILEVKQRVKLCSTCFSLSDQEKCHICSNPRRDPATICVVENPTDMVAIERSGAFFGLYHVLGGSLSPMDGIGPDELRIKELFSRIDKSVVTEVIIATGTNVEGESTASYISDNLRKKGINVTRIASGVPMGGDLQYVDQVTMQRAMEGRHGF